jgi:hydrogenase expression/formation protein HypC
MCLAVPGIILSIEDDEGLLRTGVVDFNGVRKKVNLGFIEHAGIGDYVLIHAGVALSTVSAAHAEAIMLELESLVEEERDQ